MNDSLLSRRCGVRPLCFKWDSNADSCCSDAFQNGLARGGSLKNCLGTRNQDGGPLMWESYGEVHERILNFGSGLLEVVLNIGL